MTTNMTILYDANGNTESHDLSAFEPMPTQAIALKFADEVSAAEWITEPSRLRLLESEDAPLAYTGLMLVIDGDYPPADPADICTWSPMSHEWVGAGRCTMTKAMSESRSAVAYDENSYTISRADYEAAIGSVSINTYHDETTTATRYAIHVICGSDARTPTTLVLGEMMAQAYDELTARRQTEDRAGDHCYGVAIVDHQTGLVDVGNGWQTRENAGTWLWTE